MCCQIFSTGIDVVSLDILVEFVILWYFFLMICMYYYKFLFNVNQFSKFYTTFVLFLEKMFVFIWKCINIFTPRVIIDEIFPEKKYFQVFQLNVVIFYFLKILFVTCKFLEILNDVCMFLCEHVIFLERM